MENGRGNPGSEQGQIFTAIREVDRKEEAGA